MRLIDADVLDAKIYNDIPIKVFGSVARMANMRELVSRQPTVDAVPVVHGHWEEPEREGVMTWDKRAYAQCSVCKQKAYLGWTDNWCRHCGAKMVMPGPNDANDKVDEVDG